MSDHFPQFIIISREEGTEGPYHVNAHSGRQTKRAVWTAAFKQRKYQGRWAHAYEYYDQCDLPDGQAVYAKVYRDKYSKAFIWDGERRTVKLEDIK